VQLRVVKIVLEWLHQGCDGDSAAVFSTLALMIFRLKCLLNSASASVSFALAPKSGFGAAVFAAAAIRCVWFYCGLQLNFFWRRRQESCA